MSLSTTRNEGFRALTVFDVVPDGCRDLPVRDDWNAPHLRDGEVAIVDPGDCDLQHGELYAVAYSRGPEIMQAVWRTAGNVTTWWAMNLNRPRSRDEFDAWLRAGRTIPAADGPYRPGGLEERILGRVVGILQSLTSQVSNV